MTHRQRPATASGITFLNLEDEHGLVNVICSMGVWNRYRRVVRESPALIVRGILERSAEGVTNLLADRFEPLTVAVRAPLARLPVSRRRVYPSPSVPSYWETGGRTVPIASTVETITPETRGPQCPLDPRTLRAPRAGTRSACCACARSRSPRTCPRCAAAIPLADRILLVGNGPSHGWGVLTHQLALTGQLADAVAARTGRACDADLIGAEAMNVRSALAWIGDRDLRDVDAVVLVLGFNDALRLTPLDVWEHELYSCSTASQSRLRADAVIDARRDPADRVVPRLRGHRRADSPTSTVTRLNAATKRIADAPRRRLPRPAGADAARAPEASAAVYREFAARHRRRPRAAPRRGPARRRPRAPPRRTGSGTGAARPRSSNSPAHGGDADLRRLTEKAQKSFGVELAVVSLVDGDRLYHGTNTDVVPASVPLELSFCQYTVESGEPVIIPDTGKDPRFEDNPLVDVSFINFYAGYPLRATDGHVIGSFCLQGSQPRRESAVALDLLRQLALEAQEVLRGYETETPARGAVQVVMPMPTGRTRSPSEAQRPPIRRRSRSIRACSCVTVARATSGPPHSRRTSACTCA